MCYFIVAIYGTVVILLEQFPEPESFLDLTVRFAHNEDWRHLCLVYDYFPCL